ncbi:MAG TPA: CHASE sensor domain-containing protein, partial [Ramlibacter sp.]|nr:CHASE sensor domain-containing protein [Ramlibacter sp.]
MKPPAGSRSVRRKLNRVVLATTFVALILAALAMVVFDLRSFQQTWETDLATQADLLGLATAPALSFNDPKAARENLALLKARPNITAAAVLRPNGELFASYGTLGAVALPASQVRGVRVEGSNLVVLQPIVDNGETLGSVYLRARHQRAERLQQYLGVLGMVIAVSLALALLLSDHLVSLVMQPLLAVSVVARRITHSRDYSLRATHTSDDEVGEVVNAFNDMLAELARRAETLEEAHQETLNLNAQLEERVRRRTAQLEAANRELESFSYSASHDLRSPLRVIGSFTTLLDRSVGGQLDQRSRHYMDRIQANVRLMSDVIDALLTLAHVSRTSLQRSEVDLGAMAGEVIEQCRDREPQRLARVTIAQGMKAQADFTLANQVMQNLVGNAWKFTSRLEQAEIEVGYDARPGQPVVYFVRDNGAGFDMEYGAKLFSAFHRLHTPSEFPGTGIGLATVHRIVTRHDG